MSQPPSDSSASRPISSPPSGTSDASAQQQRSASELLAAYDSGNRNFARWNLAAADLKNATLKDANFFHANLTGANLSEADLTRCNFSQALLTTANLRGANISGAYFDGAVTFGADLTDTITDRPTPKEARPVVAPASQTPSQPTSAVLSSPPSTPQVGTRTATPARQNTPHAPAVPSKVRSSSKPTRTDLQVFGVGVIFVIAGILLPTQTEQCTTGNFGQYCIETVYTYNGVSAPVAKGVLIVVGILCFVIAGFLYANRNKQQN